MKCACGNDEAVVNATMNHPDQKLRWCANLCKRCFDDLKRRLVSYGGPGTMSFGRVEEGNRA